MRSISGRRTIGERTTRYRSRGAAARAGRTRGTGEDGDAEAAAADERRGVISRGLGVLPERCISPIEEAAKDAKDAKVK